MTSVPIAQYFISNFIGIPAMTKNPPKKSKDKEPEVDFSQFSMDDIARRVLETPPKPKKKEKKPKE